MKSLAKVVEISEKEFLMIFTRISTNLSDRCGFDSDRYYMAYKPMTLSCIFFMFIEMPFIHCHSCVMFAMKSMSMCND